MSNELKSVSNKPNALRRQLLAGSAALPLAGIQTMLLKKKKPLYYVSQVFTWA